MKLLFSYIKKHRGALAGALVLATINQFFSLLDPQIFRLIIDGYVSKVGKIPTHEFLIGASLLLGASVGVAFVSRVAKNFQDYFVSMITQKVGTKLYSDGVAHSFALPYTVFEDERSGELLQKLQKVRIDAQAFITSSINTIFLACVGILFVIIYALSVHPLVGIVYALIIPILGSVTYFLSRRIKAAQRAIVAESAELAGSTTETLRNVELVKSLGLEGQEINRLNMVNEKILGLELSKIKLIRVLSFIQGTVVNALRAGILFLMIWLIMRGSITLGEFFSLYIYSFFIFAPLGELGNVSAQYQEARASLEILNSVLARKPEEKPSTPAHLDTLTSITLSELSFRYESATRETLSSVSLSLTGGETIALVGPSGSGKSTVVKLLVGLYRPSAGSLLYNGTNYDTVDYQALRTRVGLVSQETQLFAGSIRENLLFVNPTATDAECMEALKSAAALPIVERGEKGLDTKIGEGGIKISGGERQRLAIARALLRKPELLIFDEATSSLDSLTERSITETIKSVVAERPTLMTVLVAHRLSTIMHATRIYVMEKGRVIEEGTHDTLVAAGGLYAALWREQSATD